MEHPTDAMCRTIAELKRENDWMVMKLNAEHLVRQNVERENDKLRELVRISIEHCNSGTCDECPIQGGDGSCPYTDMARELGIEVD